MDMQAKSKELLLGLKVLLKEYCPATFRIAVLVRDCIWAGGDPGSPILAHSFLCEDCACLQCG